MKPGKALEPCWNLAGALLEPGETGWNTLLRTNAGGNFGLLLHCFLLCLMCRVVMLEVWLELCWNRFATFLEPK